MKRLLPVVALAPALVMAQSRPPIATDRPGFSDGSNVVGKGVNQLEVGFFRTVVGGDSTTTLPDLLFRHGLTEDVELRLVGLTYGFAPADARGFLDPSVGFKVRLQRPSGKRGELTIEGQTTVKTSDDPLRANAWNPTFKLLATTPLGNDSLGANLVWSRIGPEGAQFDQSALALSYARTLSPKAVLTYEAWGVDHFALGEKSAFYGSLALTYTPNNDTQWDIRLGSGFNQARDGWFLQGGYSERF